VSPTDLPPNQPGESRDLPGSSQLRCDAQRILPAAVWPDPYVLYSICAALHCTHALQRSSEQIAMLHLHRLLRRLESFGTAHPGLRPEAGCISEVTARLNTTSTRGAAQMRGAGPGHVALAFCSRTDGSCGGVCLALSAQLCRLTFP
jgi:hypothetical protein